MIGAIAMTEPGAGSDLKSLRTSARREGDAYVINGQKIYISTATTRISSLSPRRQIPVPVRKVCR